MGKLTSDNLLENLLERFSKDKRLVLNSHRLESNNSLRLRRLEPNIQLCKSAELYICPRTELTSIEELNLWMDEISIGLEPKDRLPFGYNLPYGREKEGNFYFGKLLFEQLLGTIERESVVTRRIRVVNSSEAKLQKMPFNEEITTVEKSHLHKRDYTRTVDVSLFFSKKFMDDYFNSEDKTWSNIVTHMNSFRDVYLFSENQMGEYGILAGK